MSTRKRVLLALAKEQLKLAIYANAHDLISLYESAIQDAKRLIEEAEEIS